jgi:hypothetical protein
VGGKSQHRRHGDEDQANALEGRPFGEISAHRAPREHRPMAALGR